MATPEQILASFKEFADGVDGQELYLEQADATLASAEFFNTTDDDRNWAVAAKAADLMVQAGLGTISTQAGAVISETIGRLSTTYAQPKTNGAASSSYGKMLDDWIAAHLMTPRTSYG